jgi:nicotinamide-nucleotide adenylyltransferase
MARALILGRFQPPHRGHLHVIGKAAAEFDEVFVVVGSAQASYTRENPFTAGERIEMLEAALSEAGLDNVRVYPTPDINRHAQWVAYLDSQVPRYETVVTNNPLTRVLFTKAGYDVREGDLWRREECSGTRIRTMLADGEPVADLVPPAVARVLDRLDAGKRIRALWEDHGHG